MSNWKVRHETFVIIGQLDIRHSQIKRLRFQIRRRLLYIKKKECLIGQLDITYSIRHSQIKRLRFQIRSRSLYI